MNDPSDWVLAAPFRCHARWLCESSGVDARTLAVLAGVPTRTLLRLLAPARPRHSPDRLRRQDAQRLFALDPAQVHERASQQVAAGRAGELAARLLQLLPAEDAARVSGIAVADLLSLASRERPSCQRLVEARIQAALLRARAGTNHHAPRVGGMELGRAA